MVGKQGKGLGRGQSSLYQRAGGSIGCEESKQRSRCKECLRGTGWCGDRGYASITAKEASARSAWGRTYDPTSASRAVARSAGDWASASMTAKGDNGKIVLEEKNGESILKEIERCEAHLVHTCLSTLPGNCCQTKVRLRH